MTSTANVFSSEFYQSEIAVFNPVPFSEDGVCVEIIESVTGRCDGIFYKSFNTLENIPTFRIDGRLWMSITPLEVESHWIPIQIADGPFVETVAVGGIGLGYYLVRIMGMSHIKKIIAYEKEQRVVEYFKSCYGHRDGFNKIEFVVGDIRETFVGQSVDFCYMDIYPSVASPEAIDDKVLFCKANRIANYWFWTEERFLMDVVIGKRSRNYAVTSRLTKNPDLVNRLFRKFFLSEYRRLISLDGYGYDIEETQRYIESNKLHRKPLATRKKKETIHA